MKKTNQITNATTTTITADNVLALSQKITLSALNTIYAMSANNYIMRIHDTLVKDIKENTANSDGADLVQDVALYLSAYIGMTLTDNDESGAVAKNGAPVTIIRKAYRIINNNVHKNKQIDYKKIYLDDVDNDTKVSYSVPYGWDVDKIEDYKDISTTINGLNLSVNEKKVLNYRMQGLGYDNIAKLMRISKSSVRTYLSRIQAKYIAYKEDK